MQEKSFQWKPIFFILLISIGIKIIYLSLALGFSEDINNTKDVSANYIQMVKKNDSYWYQKITKNGYRELRSENEIGYSKAEKYTQSEWAFFPLYPMLNYSIITLFDTDFDTSAFILSILFSFLSMLGLFYFVKQINQDSRKSLYLVLLLFSFPFAYYFHMYYTEAIFFTLLIWSFVSIQHQKYWLLSILLIPLVLVRPNGVIMLIPLYLFHLEQMNLLQRFNINMKAVFSKKNLLFSLAFLTGPLMFLLYLYYQYEKTGFFLAFSIAQRGWYREFMWPFLSFFRKGDLATQFNSVYTIVFILLAILLRKRIPFSLNILIVISFLLPLSSGSVGSMTRFIPLIFPLIIALGQITWKSKIPYTVLILVFLLQLASFVPWLQGIPLSH
jgi:hypothetical protein